jgi:hypothetical protein
LPVKSQNLDFQRHISWSFCVPLLEVICDCSFVDIGGIVDHYGLNLFFLHH